MVGAPHCPQHTSYARSKVHSYQDMPASGLAIGGRGSLAAVSAGHGILGHPLELPDLASYKCDFGTDSGQGICSGSTRSGADRSCFG